MAIKNLLLIAGFLTSSKMLSENTFKEFAQACEAVVGEENVISKFEYAICQKQLYKKEDRYDVYEKDGFFLCGVFDGHGGPEIADDLTKDHMFLKKLQSAISSLNAEETTILGYEYTIEKVFKAQDQDFLENANKYERFTIIDKQKESLFETAGSTATVAIITPDKKVFVAYIGDSCARIHMKNESNYHMGKHRPHNEEARIREAAQKLGEKIENVLSLKENRVCGVEVSRAFGDFTYNQTTKKWFKLTGIIATPDIDFFAAQGSSFGEAKFIVLASDGLWDGLPLIIGKEWCFSQYFSDFFEEIKANKSTIQSAAQELCEKAESGWEKAQEINVAKKSGFAKKTKDDVTVALIRV